MMTALIPENYSAMFSKNTLATTRAYFLPKNSFHEISCTTVVPFATKFSCSAYWLGVGRKIEQMPQSRQHMAATINVVYQSACLPSIASNTSEDITNPKLTNYYVEPLMKERSRGLVISPIQAGTTVVTEAEKTPVNMRTTNI